MIAFTTLSIDAEGCDSLISTWTSEAERAQAAHKISASKAREFLVVRAAVYKLLAHETGQTGWRIEKEATGKPFIVKDGKVGPFISISHSKGLVACCLSEIHPIGVDVEFWQLRDFKNIAEECFNDAQRHDIVKEGAPAFYHHWCVKEAIAKVTGKGIFAEGKMSGATFANSLSQWMKVGSYAIVSWQPLTNYTLAIAVKPESEKPSVPRHVEL
jgi:phosphopantetheinyl transferase